VLGELEEERKSIGNFPDEKDDSGGGRRGNHEEPLADLASLAVGANNNKRATF
jgi:hypothetical protein